MILSCTNNKSTAIANYSTSEGTKKHSQTCSTDVSRVYFQSVLIPVWKEIDVVDMFKPFENDNIEANECQVLLRCSNIHCLCMYILVY